MWRNNVSGQVSLWQFGSDLTAPTGLYLDGSELSKNFDRFVGTALRVPGSNHDSLMIVTSSQANVFDKFYLRDLDFTAKITLPVAAQIPAFFMADGFLNQTMGPGYFSHIRHERSCGEALHQTLNVATQLRYFLPQVTQAVDICRNEIQPLKCFDGQFVAMSGTAQYSSCSVVAAPVPPPPPPVYPTQMCGGGGTGKYSTKCARQVAACANGAVPAGNSTVTVFGNDSVAAWKNCDLVGQHCVNACGRGSNITVISGCENGKICSDTWSW